MDKHTPGPWKATYRHAMNSGVDVACVMDAKNYWLADCGSNEEPTFQANARLIAAAPDLLDALEDLVKTVNMTWNDGKNSYRTERARAAIAKARGE